MLLIDLKLSPMSPLNYDNIIVIYFIISKKKGAEDKKRGNSTKVDRL